MVNASAEVVWVPGVSSAERLESTAVAMVSDWTGACTLLGGGLESAFSCFLTGWMLGWFAWVVEDGGLSFVGL